MPTLDARRETINAIVRRISDLNDQSWTQLSQYISYLKWQEELWNSLLDERDHEAAPSPHQALIFRSLPGSAQSLDTFTQAHGG